MTAQQKTWTIVASDFHGNRVISRHRSRAALESRLAKERRAHAKECACSGDFCREDYEAERALYVANADADERRGTDGNYNF